MSNDNFCTHCGSRLGELGENLQERLEKVEEFIAAYSPQITPRALTLLIERVQELEKQVQKLTPPKNTYY